MSDHQETEVVTQNTSQMIDNIIKNWEESIRNLKTFTIQLRQVKKEIISMEKENEKQKKSKRNKQKKNENKKPSGFAIPKEISTELADFLGVERGATIARTEVTKLLTTYIRDNDLKDPTFKRNIVLTSEAGKKLGNILSPLVDDKGEPVVLSYFNLQKYIKHHFPTSSSNTPVVTTNTVSVPETTTENTDTTTPKKTVMVKKIIKKPIGVHTT